MKSKQQAEAAPVGGQHMVTLAKGGTAEKTLPLSQVEIPDLWHIAQAELDLDCRRAILTCWHNAHDLKRIVEEQMDLNAQLLEALQAILNDAEDFINDEDGPPAVETFQAIREMARAAIAQAEGRVV